MIMSISGSFYVFFIKRQLFSARVLFGTFRSPLYSLPQFINLNKSALSNLLPSDIGFFLNDEAIQRLHEELLGKKYR